MHDHINYRDILSSREHSQYVLTIAQVVLQHNHTTCKATKVVRVENRGVRGGAPMGEALLILHLLAFPFLRSGTVVYLGGAVVLLPPLGVPKIQN